MPILQVVADFMVKGKDLVQRMRSPEGVMLSMADLQLLKDQLQILDNEITQLMNHKQRRNKPRC